MVVTLNSRRAWYSDGGIIMSEKIKMDKVRRLLANRYGEEARDAVLAILGHVVEVGAVGEFYDDMDSAVVESGFKAIEDLVNRANKGPRVIEIADEEVVEEQ